MTKVYGTKLILPQQILHAESLMFILKKGGGERERGKREEKKGKRERMQDKS